MDWFERLTGFRELPYEETRAKFDLGKGRLRSHANGREIGIGELEIPTLAELRSRVVEQGSVARRSTVSILTGDVRALHRDPGLEGALFQVASQFNLLEMIGPDVTPEHGVTRYQSDHTQGPACAIAAGGATIFRNYFASVDGQSGQTRHRQINCLADIGAHLSGILGIDEGSLLKMRNGYALSSRDGIEAIANYLSGATPDEVDVLRSKLRIGIHSDVEVTDIEEGSAHSVSQAFCSGLPVSYSDCPDAPWRPFAQAVLEASYEATLLASVLNVQRGGSNAVMLTQIGGGCFGNRAHWIDAAIRRALALVELHGLDVRIVCYDSQPAYLRQIVSDFS